MRVAGRVVELVVLDADILPVRRSFFVKKLLAACRRLCRSEDRLMDLRLHGRCQSTPIGVVEGEQIANSVHVRVNSGLVLVKRYRRSPAGGLLRGVCGVLRRRMALACGSQLCCGLSAPHSCAVGSLRRTAVLWALCAQVVVRARVTQGVHAYAVVLSILLDRYTLV